MPPDDAQQTNQGQGRIEIRQCGTRSEPEAVADLDPSTAGKGLRTLVRVRAERRIGDQRSVEERYYLSRLAGTAKRALRAARGHGGLEHKLHGVLDLAFREDESRVRKDHAPENFAGLRPIALNLLKQETTAQRGIHPKPLSAGWDEAYLLSLGGLQCDCPSAAMEKT